MLVLISYMNYLNLTIVNGDNSVDCLNYFGIIYRLCTIRSLSGYLYFEISLLCNFVPVDTILFKPRLSIVLKPKKPLVTIQMSIL